MKIRFEVPNKLEIFLGREADCDGCGDGGDEGRSVGELLLPQYALATGGLARDHRPLITFPDHSNFHVLTPPEYRRLLLYLTSVPSLLEADMGFHIIIDRRKDRWNSVKTVLIRISEFFPGVIHAVYVLRPASFLQKALSEVSSKLFKEEFRFKVLVCSLEELYEHFDRSQLTPDLGGELQYSHSEWIQQRIALEKFSTLMKEISTKLDEFMHEIVDCDMGNDPTQTKELLDCQESRYKALKTELSSATSQGEELLLQVRKPNLTYNIISHVAAVERLLVQLEETERQFDNFWQKHSTKLNHWLRFRTFLLNFKQMQATLDGHLKKACDMTEVGETGERVESLIQEANDFEKLCNCDLDTASTVVEDGEKLMEDPLSSVDHIESKCEELRRTSALLFDKIQKRNLLLTKAKELMDRIDKANEWCATGVELLAGEGGLQAVDKLLEDAQSFGLTGPDQFRDMLMQSATQETRALVGQVVQRVEDVWLMVSVKRATLQRAAAKPVRPVQCVPPQSAAPPSDTVAHNHHMETSGGSESSGGEDAEARRARRGHVLAELLHTERVYVQELGSILKSRTRSAAMHTAAPDAVLAGVCRNREAERVHRNTFANCTSVQTLGRALHFVASCTMKYGKYDLHKSSANVSIGTSYSWYYRKNDSTTTKKKKKRLVRTASDSTLFSDYTNQISMFDKEKINKKCKKSISCASKNSRVKCNMPIIKPVHMEPFTGNFYYGRPLPGYEFSKKTEEKITYLPDSDAVSPSEETLTTVESITTAATIIDLPELVKNPLYGCPEADLHVTSPEYFTDTISKDSQLNTSSCTEIKETMCSNKDSDDIYGSILRDFKRNMKEWNNTVMDHYSSSSHASKKSSSMCRSNTTSYIRSLHSTLSCRKYSKKENSSNNRSYDYAYVSKVYGDQVCRKTTNASSERKCHTLDRNQTFNTDTDTRFSSTLRNLKKKAKFWKESVEKLSPSECDCLETIYEDYDRRLQEWCDSLSSCSSFFSSGYKEEIEKAESQHLIPAALVGQADVLFGNLHELFTFHQDVFLKDIEKCISATELVALCFVQKRDTFFRLYSYYCQNIPRSERLRETLVDTHLFLQACQLRLGHKLPLAAYLLKPVQRITKYQLLLKDLLRYSECGSVSAGLQEALDCMLVVLKCVNDSMHQIAITGFPVDLCQQGELLMQGSFMVVSDSKRDLRLRLRARRRHIFLYEKSMLFCKPAAKNSHNKATYHFKHDLQMSQIGLTESVKGDTRKFEVWRQGRSEVHTITAPTVEVKRAWVARIKRVLLDQLEELKGERVRQYGAQHHRALTTASSWDLGPVPPPAPPRPHPAPPSAPARTASCDTHDEPCWSTDPSEDEEEEPDHTPAVGCGLVALSDYTAVGASEVSLREGQQAELLKVGCAGWWYVRLAAGHGEGWAPAAYLDQRKTSRSSSRSHDRLHDH